MSGFMRSNTESVLGSSTYFQIRIHPMKRNFVANLQVARASFRRLMLPHVLFVDSFFEHLERLSLPDYIPTHEDILHARQSTQGVQEKKISVNNFQYRYLYSTYTYFIRNYERDKFKCWMESYCLLNFLINASFRRGFTPMYFIYKKQISKASSEQNGTLGS